LFGAPTPSFFNSVACPLFKLAFLPGFVSATIFWIYHDYPVFFSLFLFVPVGFSIVLSLIITPHGLMLFGPKRLAVGFPCLPLPHVLKLRVGLFFVPTSELLRYKSQSLPFPPLSLPTSARAEKPLYLPPPLCLYRA